MFFIIYTTNTKSVKYPYFFPIAPFDRNYFSNTVVKTSINNDQKRSKYLTKNIIKKDD